MIYVSNTLSLIAIIYLIFISWKKGPEWYLKISPKIYYTMLYLNYIILPVINIGIMVFFTLSPKFDLKILPLETWVIFVTIINFSRLLEYFATLKKILHDDARIYLAARKAKLDGEELETPEEGTSEANKLEKVLIEIENEDCSSYLARSRLYGEGEIRIGRSLNLKNDIYCIGFICQIRNDIMEEHLDINKKKLDRKDIVRKKAMRFHTVKKKKVAKK